MVAINRLWSYLTFQRGAFSRQRTLAGGADLKRQCGQSG